MARSNRGSLRFRRRFLRCPGSLQVRQLLRPRPLGPSRCPLLLSCPLSRMVALLMSVGSASSSPRQVDVGMGELACIRMSSSVRQMGGVSTVGPWATLCKSVISRPSLPLRRLLSPLQLSLLPNPPHPVLCRRAACPA